MGRMHTGQAKEDIGFPDEEQNTSIYTETGNFQIRLIGGNGEDRLCDGGGKVVG